VAEKQELAEFAQLLRTANAAIFTDVDFLSVFVSSPMDAESSGSSFVFAADLVVF
jgi:hypothetical protein